MTSRGNQSVSPPTQLSQQRHVNTLSSNTPPPPQQYFPGSSPALPHGGYEYLQQAQAQPYLSYQAVPAFGNALNEIRGQAGNNGRVGPLQQGLTQGGGFYQHGPNIRPQQMQQGPAPSQQYFISNAQSSGMFCPPRPPHQPSGQQMVYLSQGNFQPGSNVFTMPAATMYGHTTLPVYPQGAYLQGPAYPQPTMMCYPNGTPWRSQSMAPAAASYARPREKKVLNITDPNTGRDIMQDVLSNRSHSAETDDSYEQVPAANQNNKEICQIFTRMVADRLKSPDEPNNSGAMSDSQGPGMPAVPTPPSQLYDPFPPQQLQQPLSSGPASMMRNSTAGPPPSVPHQGMPPRSGLVQQPPASLTPPHDMQHQMINVNLSMPPPHLPLRQPQQQVFSPAHHVSHHPQTMQQQIRPHMPPTMPAQLQQVQSPHQTPPPQPPPHQAPPHQTLSQQPMSQQILSQQSGSQLPNSQQPNSQQVLTQQPSSQLPHSQQFLPQQSSAQKFHPQQVNPQQVLTQQSNSQQVLPQQPNVHQVHTQQPNTQQVLPQQTSSQLPGSQQFVPQQPNTQQVLPQQTSSQLPGSQQFVPQQPSPQQFHPQQPPLHQTPIQQMPLHQLPPNQSPPYGQISSSMTVNTAHQPFEPLQDSQKHYMEVSSQNNIPARHPEPPFASLTQPAKTVSSVVEAPQVPQLEQVDDDKFSAGKTATAPREEQINDRVEDSTREETSQGSGSHGVKDGRKNKKNLKGLNCKDIEGSDMDAFIDKVDEASIELDESCLSKTNNALETANNSNLSANTAKHSVSEELETLERNNSSRVSEIADLPVSPKSLAGPETSITALTEGGHLKDRETVNAQRSQESQKSATQVESKQKQKKKRKKEKGHHSPPSQKSKSTAVDVSEKSNEAVDSGRKSSVPLSPPESTDAVDDQDSSSPNQETADADSIPQSSLTDNKTVVDNKLSEDNNVEMGFSVEDTPAAATTESVISVSSLDSSIYENEYRGVSEGRSEHSSGDAADQLDSEGHERSPVDSVQSDTISEPSKGSTQVVCGESELSQGSDDIQQETQRTDIDDAPAKPADYPSNKVKKGVKLQYDRAYLMELRECPSSLAKPEGLPDLEIILELPINNNRGTSAAPLDFTPAFFQVTGNTRHAPQIGKTNSRSRQRPDLMPQRVIKSVSLQDNIKPLHQSEKPWKPTPKQLTAGELAEKKKSLEGEVLFIMNRLTPTNFERLAEEMRNLDIKTYEDLQELVRIFFDKVTIETKFVEAYAKLCKVMSSLKVPPPPNSGIKESQATFRVVMLTKCQQEFEADKTTIFEDPEEKRKKMEAELPDGPDKAEKIENTLYQMKMRRLKFYGNIRFIGELFKLGMLTENIMHDCIFRLLKAKDDESLLSLCNLVSTVGQALDTDKSKSRMDNYFAQMAKIAEERKSRIKFTLKDIIDLRNNNWIPRKEQTGPKKIDEVHKDFQQEQATKQFLQAQPTPPRVDTPQTSARRGSKQRQDDKQMTDDGWNTVGSKSLRIDASKMRLSKNIVDENSIQLGPGGGMNKFSMWSRGSYGGAQPSQDNDKPISNRFSALRSEEDRRGYQRSPTRTDSGPVSSRAARQGPMAGHGRGKVISRSSQEGERRDSLPGRSYAGERFQNSSRDNSWNREDRRQPMASREADISIVRSNGSLRPNNDSLRPPSAASPASAGTVSAGYDDDVVLKKLKPLSADEMENKAKTILEEYLNAMDLEEAKLCMLELRGQEHLDVLVTTCVNEVLEKSHKERDLTGSFFHEILRHGLLPLEVFLKGFSQVLGYAEDMVIDIPKMWTYLAQVIVPVLIGGSISWPTLSEALTSQLDKRCCAKLVAEILLVAKEKTSQSEVAEMWQSSGMDWAAFLDPAERTQFLKDKKLLFTTEPVDRPQAAAGTSSVDLQKLTEDIESIVRRNGSNDEIFSRINKYTSAEQQDKHFIRAVVTAVVNGSISPTSKKLNDEVLKSHKEVLQHCVRGSTEMELQALYAIQALMHKLEHPPGIINSIFSILYDEDMISEEAFKRWEDSSDPQEAEGKGACSMQLTQFFTWLRENEELEAS